MESVKMDIWFKGNLEQGLKVGGFRHLKEMLEAFVSICAKDTSSDPDNWSRKNPVHGHCVLFALRVQTWFGGELLRASLEELQKYRQMKSHYWNRFPENLGFEIDLSAGQFERQDRNLISNGEIRTRESLLNNPDTAKRYDIFCSRARKRGF